MPRSQVRSPTRRPVADNWDRILPSRAIAEVRPPMRRAVAALADDGFQYDAWGLWRRVDDPRAWVLYLLTVVVPVLGAAALWKYLTKK